MQVADAMTPREDVVTVSLPGTRDDALSYLQERRFSSVPVVKSTAEREVYRGLVSRTDLIARPDEDQLALLMREVPTTAAATDLVDAAALMRAEDCRRVPVVEGDELRGIVTVSDIVRAIAHGDVSSDVTVGTLAARSVHTTHRETPIRVVARGLRHARVPYAVVLDDDGDMCGIVTEVDIIAVATVVEGETDTGDAIAGQDDEWQWEGIKPVGNRHLPTRNVELPDGPVSEPMSTDVETVTRRRTAREAARLMIETDVEQLPLTVGGELAGIVRDVDLLAGLGGAAE